MLPRAYRLKIPTKWSRQPDFQLKTDLFKIIGKSNPDSKTFKIGFIISGKIGKATIRNRIRRKISHEIHSKIERMNPEIEAILIAYPNIAKASNEEISFSIDKIVSKLYI